MLRSALSVWFLSLVISSCTPPSSGGFVAPDYYPVFPGCESFRSKDAVNWCFIKKFSDSLNRIARTDTLHFFLHRMIPKDTLWFQIQVDDRGIVKLDSVFPVTKAYDSVFHIAKKWTDRMPVVKPALLNNRPVKIRFRIPFIFVDENAAEK